MVKSKRVYGTDYIKHLNRSEGAVKGWETRRRRAKVEVDTPLSKSFTDERTPSGYHALKSDHPEDGDPRFYALLEEMWQMHCAKAHDYSSQDDFLANLSQAAEFGVKPWVGAVVRSNDKLTRIKSFIRKNRLRNEGIRDSLLDMANYFAIAVILYDRDE